MTSACPPSKPEADAGVTVLPDGGAPVTQSAFLFAAGQCAARDVQAFQGRAAAFAASPTVTTWKDAMAAWQRVEVMQFGPTASSTTPGGMDFRDQIYSWPLTSRCAVDETLTRGLYTSGAASLLINRRGLAAAEVLLFTAPGDVTCGDTAAWATLPEAEQTSRRAAYLQVVANDVKAQADGLVAAWATFPETMRTAGAGNATYATALSAVNRVSDAVFYLDLEVKDLKLAGPIGLRNCTTPPCVEQLESQYAKVNTSNVRANLAAVRQLLEGCDDGFSGPGFDDLLDAQGAFEVAARLRAAGANAQAKLDLIDEPDLSQSLVSDPQSVRDFYDALKGITDLMKTEWLLVLGVDLPMGLEGDND